MIQECGIVRNGDKLDMYVDDIKLSLSEEQFNYLTYLYSQMKNHISNPFCSYYKDGEVHFLITKQKED